MFLKIPYIPSLRSLMYRESTDVEISRCWGGSPNIVWFFNRERGVAGFFGTQIEPFGDPLVKELVNSWKKDFWSKIDKE